MGKTGFPAQLKSNRGTGIVTVLVTMLFITALGATLLFTSYTGYLIKVSERGGKASFYSAGAAMDEIKAGVQQAVTESLSTAYTRVLSEYVALSSGGEAQLQEKFSDYFVLDLQNWQTEDDVPLFVSNGTEKQCNAEALELFLSPHAGIAEVAGGACVVTESEIRLQGVSVTYTSPDHYQSIVTTDIRVTMPDFNATAATVVSSKLQSFALIANGDLSGTSVRTLTGNAYAGSITLAGSGNGLAYAGGAQGRTLVCRENLSVANGAALTVNGGTELWARNIVLGTAGSAVLLGRTFVADDLTLAGNGAQAVLKGSYYGFGDGATADTSSAVVINGHSAVFDVSGLDRLVLAGVSFVDASGVGVETSAAIRTGESVSAKSDQLAYLVDPDEISFADPSAVIGSNPYIFTGSSIPAATVPAKIGEATVTRVVKHLGTNYGMIYYFLNFSSQEQANDYFRYYFTANSEEIESYISSYAQLKGLADITRTAGNTLYADSGGLQLHDSSENTAALVSGYDTQFRNRCQTFNPGRGSAATPELTPYVYFINSAMITENVDFFLDGSASPNGRVVNGDYTIASGETAKVIIATGSIIVSSNYSGLIIAGGNVSLGANATYDPDGAEEVLYGARSSDGVPLSSYLNDSTSGGSGDPASTSRWDLDILVSYENWSKS